MSAASRASLDAGFWIGKTCLHSLEHHRWMNHGHRDETVGMTDTPHFSKQPVEVGNVIDHQSAYNSLELIIIEWQVHFEIVLKENNVAVWSLGTCLVQHSLGKVDSRDVGALIMQCDCMPPRAASDIQDSFSLHVSQ